MTDAAHVPLRPWRCQTLDIRGLRYNLRKWGDDSARPILFLHGTQDSSVTFQFLVDRLKGDWLVVAPDWRGHGHSQWVNQGYWFHEFVADLAAIMDSLFPGRAVPVVGHSLGGNIASIYAGLRPGRVSHLISLDGFGPLTSLVPVDIKQILSRLLSIAESPREHASYPNVDDMAQRLMRGNARLTREMAAFLAEHSSVDDGGGGRRWLFDPTHQMALPSIHTIAEWGHVWSAIQGPVLWVSSQDRRPAAAVNVPGEMDRRAAMMPGLRRVALSGTGHNLHHDEPGRVAGLIERFVDDPSDPVFASAGDPASGHGSAESSSERKASENDASSRHSQQS